MPAFICRNCGIQYAETSHPPDACRICQEERQYAGLSGPRWTTLDELMLGHHNQFVEGEPGLPKFLPEPKFAIGQRAFVVGTEAGMCCGIACGASEMGYPARYGHALLATARRTISASASEADPLRRPLRGGR